MTVMDVNSLTQKNLPYDGYIIAFCLCFVNLFYHNIFSVEKRLRSLWVNIEDTAYLTRTQLTFHVKNSIMLSFFSETPATKGYIWIEKTTSSPLNHPPPMQRSLSQSNFLMKHRTTHLRKIRLPRRPMKIFLPLYSGTQSSSTPVLCSLPSYPLYLPCTSKDRLRCLSFLVLCIWPTSVTP